ncbi:MAG: hypothetical protein J6B81_02695 [Spirochaetaceae bacterium]|nr:hypothetical protein [Spirochaetaceae bacterium]
MKKFIISLIIIIIFAAVVFYFGWVQFAVPTGSCGVLISKTSGVYPKPIVAGEFTWCWERLLPTNTELRIFSLDPVYVTDTLSATLPSGGVYSSFLTEAPDFSYSVTMKTSAKIKPESIVLLVEQQDIKNQDELNEIVRQEIRQFNAAAVEMILQAAQQNTTTLSLQPLSTEELVKGTSNSAANFSNIDILSAQASNIKVPDMALYNFAKSIYMQSQSIDTVAEGTNSTIKPSTATQLENLVELGELLTKYPVLLDYLKDTSLEETLQAFE